MDYSAYELCKRCTDRKFDYYCNNCIGNIVINQWCEADEEPYIKEIPQENCQFCGKKLIYFCVIHEPYPIDKCKYCNENITNHEFMHFCSEKIENYIAPLKENFPEDHYKLEYNIESSYEEIFKHLKLLKSLHLNHYKKLKKYFKFCQE